MEVDKITLSPDAVRKAIVDYVERNFARPGSISPDNVTMLPAFDGIIGNVGAEVEYPPSEKNCT